MQKVNSKFVLRAWKKLMTVVEHVEGFQIEIKNLFQLNAIHEVCVVMSRYIKRMCGCDLTVDGVTAIAAVAMMTVAGEH